MTGLTASSFLVSLFIFLSSLPVAGCIPPTAGAIFNPSAGQTLKIVLKPRNCANVGENEDGLRVVQTVCKLPKNNIWYCVKKRGERVRVTQRGWDALNRTQTARSYLPMHSQFILVTDKKTEKPNLRYKLSD